MPLRILLDTNVLISAALFPDGFVSALVSYMFETHCVVLASYSIHECKTVFQRKFPSRLAALEDFMANITYEVFVTPETICPQDFPTLRDATDVPILASAILANVDILITGDKDFSPVNMDRPLIFTPRQYYDLIPH